MKNKASKKIKKVPKKVIKPKPKKKVTPKKPVKPVNEIKFYYFDCYAAGEPIRMALNKAGIRYKDIRMDPTAPRQQFNELRDQGLFEYG